MRVPSLVGAFSAALLFLLPAAAVEVWFAPPDDLDRGPKTYNHDFSHLFDPSPAWSGQADALVLSPLFTQSMFTKLVPDDYVKHVTDFLENHHIALAVSIGAVQMDNAERTSGECGGGEGYTRPNRNNIIFNRLKRSGLNVQYVALDEPLTYGHQVDRKNACGFSIEEVAKRVAASISEIRKFYPDVKFVDYESGTVVPANQWLPEFQTWLKAYRQATGTPPDLVVFDVDWRKPWLEAVRPATAILHRDGIRAGIFLDGTGPGTSDADAIAAYKRNMRSVDDAKLPLDVVLIANWTPHPERNLPESDPDTLTGVLHYYMAQHGHGK